MRSRLVLALAAVAFAVLAAATSIVPDPRAWGINLAGYLPVPERILVLGLVGLGAALLLLDARPAARAGGPGRTTAGGAAARRPRRGSAGRALPSWWPFLLLPALVLAFDMLRVSTHLLGDGQVWIDSLSGATLQPYSEPLSSAIWSAYASLLRFLGAAVSASSLRWLPMACGVAAFFLIAGLAAEISSGGGTRRLVGALLLGLGTTQLYFGYIESYPIASVALLAYLLLLLRAARGASPVWLAGLHLAVAIAAHLIFVYLAPSFAWLALRSRVPPWRRAAEAAVPVAALVALFGALGFGLADILRPFAGVAGAAEESPGFRYGLTGALTWRHLRDLGNLLLLTAPAPLLLLLARAFVRGKGGPRNAPPLRPLLIAAVPGLLAAALLLVPGSPAQDWDLMSMTVVPGAILAVAAARPVLAGMARSGRLGLVLLSGGALLSFVLTNAGETSSVRRFASLVSPASDLSPHERAYGNEKLVQYHFKRREFEAALPFARRMVQAEPTNPRYWVKAGSVLYALGRYDDARPYFEEALRRSPGRADALYNLGLCDARTGRAPQALAEFRAAVAADSTRPEYRHNLGVMLYAAGRRDSALAVWKGVVRRWPGYLLSEQSLERHYGRGGDAALR